MNARRTRPRRPNLSEELANQVRDMIFDGNLRAGQRINEVHLAERLGVSRTPVREALTMLVAEEALVSIPRRGCFVRELTRAEFEDVYQMRPILEPEALRLAGIPSAADLDRLERLNAKIRGAPDMKTRVTLDEAWHLELVGGCGNEVLMGLVRHFMHRFRRYGLAFARERTVIETANREHVEILRSLRAGDLPGACDWLRKNLSSNKQPILDWLDERADEATPEVRKRA
ncbi:MAG: GntR family transcriptional regulator [Gemmatimonadales bacterium]|jgi:DNA-binding GntR family transcriptional regulator